MFAYLNMTKIASFKNIQKQSRDTFQFIEYNLLDYANIFEILVIGYNVGHNFGYNVMLIKLNI